MEGNKAISVYGIVMIYLLSLGNLFNIVWTIWLTVEQIQTGWFYGTDMELAVLWPWLIELLCSPLLIGGIVYFILQMIKPSNKKICIANIVLFSLLVLQYFVTNLFILF